MNQEVLDLLANADKVLVGIGESFERKDSCFLTESFKQFEKENSLLAGWERLQYWKKHPDQKAIDAYNRLFEIIKEKDYFVVTTCMDDRIYDSMIPEEKIAAPCGTWRFLQCSVQCTDELLPVTSQMVDKGEIILCPHCGKVVSFNQVNCEKYNESGYMAQWAAYRNWLQRTINQKLCILELGVGMRYPTIIRWPFEKIAYCNNKASFVRVHEMLYQLTPELSDKGNSIEASPIDFLLA